jgi:hypothetical protein
VTERIQQTRPSPTEAADPHPRPVPRRRRPIVTALAAALVLVGVLLFIVVGQHKAPAPPFRFFAADSFWNKPLPADAPVDPTSAGLVAHLDREVAQEEARGYGPNINTNAYSVPIYTVPRGQRMVRVVLDTQPNPALTAAFSAVPVPDNAHPAGGTDALLVVWQPSTDRMWEFWQLHREAGVWHARWGGAMAGVQHSDGIFGTGSWPGAQYYWGAAATSLPEVGGLMTLADLRRHQIDHVLALGIPDPREHVFTWPAQRTDGLSTDPTSLPEGARLRLDPRLNLAALHLPPLTLEIARAAQRYGIVIHDTSGVISLYAEDPTPTGSDPYWGRHGFFGGSNPRALLASFPWTHLEVLKLNLHGGWNP